MMARLYPRLGLCTGLLMNHHGVFVSQTGFIYWFTHQSSWHVCILDWAYLLVYSSIILACLYHRLGLFTGFLIYHHGMFVSQTGFIYWFTHQSSWHVCIPDWVYLLVHSSIIKAGLYTRLGLFTDLPINHHGMFVSQTGLFTGSLINHQGGFVYQTGFIYWFTHESPWHVCIPDWVYLLVYSSITTACLYPRLGLFTHLFINHHGVFVSQTGFICWFTHQSSWHTCNPD